VTSQILNDNRHNVTARYKLPLLSRCCWHVTRHASRVAILLLAACTPSPQLEQREFLAMGTTVSITVADSTTQTTLNEAEQAIHHLGREWYAWNPDGELAKLNAALAAGKSFDITPELADVLARAGDVFRASDGAFDPAIAPMVERWGFNDGERDAQLPNNVQMQTWRASHATFADLRIDGRKVSSARRDVMLDLGAIGKGHAVDRAIDALKRSGIRNAIVNAGGNLRAIGRHPDHAWRIGIRHPRKDGNDGVIARIELGMDESASTSGDYERTAMLNGKRTHHLLDPRTGEPALHTASVTVIARDATLADAASTAVFIAGPDRWLQVAKALQVTGVVRIDASGRLQATRSLQSRLHVSELTVAIEWLDL
jgi:thiamine biosynthesis lipoprotein